MWQNYKFLRCRYQWRKIWSMPLTRCRLIPLNSCRCLSFENRATVSRNYCSMLGRRNFSFSQSSNRSNWEFQNLLSPSDVGLARSLFILENPFKKEYTRVDSSALKNDLFPTKKCLNKWRNLLNKYFVPCNFRISFLRLISHHFYYLQFNCSHTERIQFLKMNLRHTWRFLVAAQVRSC